MTLTGQALNRSSIAYGLHQIALIFEQDGTPGRTYADQAITVDYQVSDLAFVVEFAEKFGVEVVFPEDGSEHAWAEFPIGVGSYPRDEATSAVYAGAAVLRVVHVPDDQEVES